jgi:putative methyltransferase (TIGR04325 family)
MQFKRILRRLTEGLADAPGIRQLRLGRYERMFARNVHANLFRGVYESYEEALRSAPTGRHLGYDNPGSAKLYERLIHRIAAYDYPVLLWLQRLFDERAKRVFDFGGHVGIAYYSYRKYIRYPLDLRWTVYDLPAVVAEGIARASQQDSDRQLSFTQRFVDGSGSDVMLASGSLQYLPTSFGDMLAKLTSPPRHILVNQLPVHPKSSYFTLNSIGTAFCPYHVFAERAFVDELRRAGYELEDRWDNPGKRCDIPYPRGHSVEGYAGFYFRRS